MLVSAAAGPLGSFPMDLAAPASAAEIVVTGRALEDGFVASQPRLVLDAARLAPASGRLEDALAAVPGLATFRRASAASASPTAQGVTLRALGGNAASRAALTLDGVPQADLFAGWITFPLLDAVPLESATVTRGGGSLVAGPGAVAGAIALQSAMPATFLHLRGGSRASFDGAGGLSFGVRTGGAMGLAGRVRRSDGFLIVDPRRAGAVDVPARYRQWAIRGRAVVPVGAVTELQASLAAFDDRRLRGIAGSDTSVAGGDAAIRLVHRGPVQAEALVFAQLRNFTARALAIAPGRTVATLTLDQFATPASGVGGRLEVRPLPRLRIGGDWRFAEGETNERFRFVAGTPSALREAGGASRSAGAFIEVGHVLRSGLELSAGGRIDGWRLSDARLLETDIATGERIRDARAPDRQGWQGSWRGGLGWRLTGADAWRLSATGWSGWRLPTLNELHRPFRVGQDAIAANPGLDPETSLGAEVAVAFEPRPTLALAVTGFHTRLNGAIANVTLAQGPGVFPGVGFVGAGGAFRQRQNLAGIRSTGVEADARLSHGPWSIAGGAAVARARVDGGAAAPTLTGKRPAQAPGWWAHAGLAYEAGVVAARLDLRAEGARFEDDLNQRRLAPATTVDASLHWRPVDGLVLTLDIHNLANAFIETGFSGALVERAEPRAIFLGLRLGG